MLAADSAPQSRSASVLDMLAADKASAPQPQAVQSSPGTANNVALGALRGASRIGTTLLWPFDAMGLTGMTHGQRVASIDQFMGENADPNSLAFKGGDLAAQIAGTAGAGGLLANGVRAAGAAIPAFADAAGPLATALETGGFRTGLNPTSIPGMIGNTALRAGAGAAVGGASAGLVDPESAMSGALIGGAIPAAAPLVGKGFNAATRAIGGGVSQLLGKSTGAGADAIKTAFQAGAENSPEFLANLRGSANMEDVLEQAKAGVAQMRADRGAAYRSGMIDISKDKSILDMAPIQNAVSSIQSLGSYKGQVLNRNAGGVVQELADQVNHWAGLDPAEFHTPEGLDALKQSIGDIRDATQFGTPGRKAADSVYNSVKQQIQSQAPVYSDVMKDYASASDQIKDIERTLSLGEKSAPDTALRKLQSIMRNNVNSNYGNRMQAVQSLQDRGGVDLLPALSGQALSSWMPRGITGASETGGFLAGAIVNPAHALHAAAFFPVASPRLVGEASYGLGRAGNLLGAIPGASTGLLASPTVQALQQKVPLSLLTTIPALTASRP